MRQCSIDGCDGRCLARGYCNKHYLMWKKYGTPLKTPHGSRYDPWDGPTGSLPLRDSRGAIKAFAWVDSEDWSALRRYSWNLAGPGYVARSEHHYDDQGKRHTTKVYLHRQLLGLGKGNPHDVDHRDGDKKNNRRSNLRVATRSQNNENRVGTGKSGYPGVHWSKQKNRWFIRFVVDGKKYHGGRLFDNLDEAISRCRDMKAQFAPFFNPDRIK